MEEQWQRQGLVALIQMPAAKQLRMHQLNKAVCTKYLHRAHRPVLMPVIETSADRTKTVSVIVKILIYV